ncbi:baseplate protein [Salmonella enterica subsp. enterica serovar Heidelberg]|uniref:Baseplate protein n=17 Tax=Salmonella enterica TaxID=28901 RepID=A0A3R1CQN1_SALET|nr:MULTISPECIES: baseplate J/gp47 family protein [Salmonella]EAA0493484.1 baseplate protein [Salmonella enterica subsp. enterica serovar Typhimurium]EAA0721722.1 baseplate protein [Salmonella enterica subsp. enterica serovar Coeln]EAA3032106.1 baseplate protein [Salmonella enterica subsp. enterica serovar Kisangani]EAA4211265.1 baseplate protein [Salmonella enterica subsp. enterica serovar Adelaide]EBC9101314.1 baseplate protein [Salmonella enterica subsp. enterica serovar Schwarzengrund]EBE2
MAIAEPDFIDRDPAQITSEMIAQYEEASGKKLYPAQAERLLIDLFAYRENLVRIAIQEAAKQNLVAYSRAPMLDYLGELVGVHRLPAQAAKTTLQFSVTQAAKSNLVIPQGTRASASDSVMFATDEDVLLPAGSLSVAVTATCVVTGEPGNNWQPAQISALVDRVGNYDISVTNLTASSGGCGEENDDALRKRIQLAPESFSNAGSYGAYRFHTLSVSQSIIDVAVLGPDEGLAEGCVELYPLTLNGLPGPELLAQIEREVSKEKKRPLTDKVSAKCSPRVAYQIRARLTLFTTADQETTLAAAREAINTWTRSRQTRLGQDIVPNQIIKVLQVDGVYDVALDMPAKKVLQAHEWAECTAIDVTIAGVSDG